MKERVEQNLYYVEKILRLERVNGQMYAVVKWQNYSYKQTTKQPLESLKINPQLRQDLQRMEAEFLSRHQARPIAHQTENYVEDYLKQLYNEEKVQVQKKQEITPKKRLSSQKRKETKDKQKPQMNKSSKKMKQKLAPYQLVNCKVKAKEKVKERLKYGLGNFRPKNYFQFQEILSDVGQKILNQFKYQLPKTDLVVQSVKGFYIEGNQYKFCLCIEEKIIVVPLKQMMQLFPQNLFNYLTNFLRYSREIMSQQIKKEEKAIMLKKYNAKAVQTVSKMLNIRQHIESNKKNVFFGRNQEDLQSNMRVRLKKFLGKDEGQQRKNPRKNQSNERKKKKKQAKNEAIKLCKQLKKLYISIESQIHSAIEGEKTLTQKQNPMTSKPKTTERLSHSVGRPKKPESQVKKKSNSIEYIQVIDSGSNQLLKGKRQKLGEQNKAREDPAPDPQLRRSQRLSLKSGSGKSGSKYSEQLSDQGQLGNSLSIGGKKRRRNPSEKLSGGKKKIFKKN